MSSLQPHKLHVKYMDGVTPERPIVPRTYTLTHSDSTGDLFLTIGPVHNLPQISGWYTRLMRDEVLAEWKLDGDQPNLYVHCHVSGGLTFGAAGWRESIFRYHLPRVLEAFHYGDRELVGANPDLDRAVVWIHFHASQASRNRVENWGNFGDYRFK